MPPSPTRISELTGPYRTVIERVATDPADFLAAFAGSPRGFWGRGDRWVAWAGELARIRVAGMGTSADGGSRSAPPGHPSSRFDAIREAAHRTFREVGVSPTRVEGGLPLRFFGGFAFLDAQAESAGWAGFPSAAFILPRFVLERRNGEVNLFAAADPGDLPEMGSRGGIGPNAGFGLYAGSGTVASVDSIGRIEMEAVLRQLGSWTDENFVRPRWEDGVRRVLEAIHLGTLEKAVLARFLDVRFRRQVDVPATLGFLRDENPRAHVFLFEPEVGRSFLGAAPELLAGLRSGRFEATAVAGSMERAADPLEDARRVERLRLSAKDRSEHRVTVEDMVEVLRPHLVHLEAGAEPSVLTLARIHHLETLICGLANPAVDILGLVEALHPTPAVCGRPRAAALELIRSAEPFDRGWYAGPAGWFDASGNGEFVPALRSAVGGGTDWRLHAGAGIVDGSEPDAEWEETALKLEPALRALMRGAGELPGLGGAAEQMGRS